MLRGLGGKGFKGFGFIGLLGFSVQGLGFIDLCSGFKVYGVRIVRIPKTNTKLVDRCRAHPNKRTQHSMRTITLNRKPSTRKNACSSAVYAANAANSKGLSSKTP